jgi:N-methylhydantoinase B
MDPVTLEVLKNAYLAIPDEMGGVLKRTAYSPNIKERMDASCAIFDAEGRMIAQAEHIPVHLGSMPVAVEYIKTIYGNKGQDQLYDGDQLIMNDPFKGGSHLPDITIIKPVFFKNKFVGYAVNKAHHADVGGKSPGSMPGDSTDIYQEGFRVPPAKVLIKGREAREIVEIIRANTRTPEERIGDIRAQLAANNIGAQRMNGLIAKYGLKVHKEFIRSIIRYSEKRVQTAIRTIPNGVYRSVDYLDDDGIGAKKIKLAVKVTVGRERLKIDFNGSSEQSRGNINSPYSVSLSSVYYVLRCITDPTVPPNHGCYKPVEVVIPKGTVLNPKEGAAVSAGNVETSQRIVDLLLLAFSKALPDKIPAQSQGSMNNILIGGQIKAGDFFSYYETIAGGEGALPYRNGQNGIHTHMTTTPNTPIEALELGYPLRVESYKLIANSGGKGLFTGGMGVKRSIRILTGNSVLSLQSDRRKIAPKGLKGGENGKKGKNYIKRNQKKIGLPSKVTSALQKDDLVVIETPGGAGWGYYKKRKKKNKY